ncbi:MAG TPA: TonB-dependent receptor [Bryobacteraceae bacterium]
MMRIHPLAFLLMAGGLALGQTGSGVINGSIKDPTGAVLAGAAVRVTNEGSGVTLDTRTNDAGIYRLASLGPGVYRLEVTASGFEKTVRARLPLAVGQVLTLDLSMSLQGQADSISVDASAPLIESQTSDVAQVVGQRMVAGLPMPNRAATSLVALAPGVVMIDPGSGAENYPVFSVAGGRARNQNFTLDGGSVNNAVGLTRAQQMTSLPMDAMEEFRVISNNYSAEFGHSTGGIINLSTRSGTNDLHGSVFEYARNDAFDARNFFASQRTPIRMHQFGASLGGPIRKDKTHFFVSWERTRQLTSSTVLSTVPSLAERSGDFSGLRNAAGKPIPIYDPATTSGKNREPFAGNRIPDNRFDPVARAALDFWPLPNRQATATGANNYGATEEARLDRDIVVAKVDHQLRPSDQLTVRYYLNNSGTHNTGSFGNPVSDPDGDLTDVRVQSALVTHTHTFQPNLLNQFQASFLQRKFIDKRYGYGQDYAGQIGLAGVGATAFPNFVVPGYATLGGQVARFQTPIRDTQLLDSVSFYRGTHAWKVGVEQRWGYNKEIRDRSSAGQFTMTPLITGKPGVTGTGDALASFLLGEVNAASVLVSDPIASHASYSALFAQDQWRITDRFTLDYGLRWEVEIPRHVAGGRMNSFDPLAINPVSHTPGVVTFAGLNGTPNNAFNTDWNNFGPRVGLAYRLPGLENTVLRVGGGIFYGPTVSNTIGDAATLGFSTSASYVTSQAGLLSAAVLRDGIPAATRPPLTGGFGAVAPGRKPNTAVSYFDPRRPSPVSYQYSFEIQHELAHNLLLETGYMANISHHLTADDFSIDQVPRSLLGSGNAQARRPFPQFSNVTWINPAIGNSTYHAGFVKLEKRFSRGFSFLAHYTFSKFIDDVASGNEYGDPASYMDAYNRALDKGLSGSDVPHRAVVSVLYEVRSFGSHRLADAVLGRWKAGVFGSLQSGPVFTVTSLADATNAFPAGAVRPDLLRNPVLDGAQRTLTRWFDTSAFAAPAAFRFGDSPRSGLRGDSIRNVDFTLMKVFAITERIHTDVRAEAYNVLNHTNFNIPGHVFGAADFGVVSSARAPRTVQLGLRLSF